VISVGLLAFATPWALTALLSLPVIWWLLRVTPPAPKRIRFPAIRLLLGLAPETETPAHTPWWLMLLRLTIAALVIVALANPLWRPAERQAGNGPLLILIDNGWTAANDWPRRINLAQSIINTAGRANRRIAIAGTVLATSSPEITFDASDVASSNLRTFAPYPLPPTRSHIVEQIELLDMKPEQVVWISDGLDFGFAETLTTSLEAQGIAVDLIEPSPSDHPLALLPPATGTGALSLPVLRASTQSRAQGALTAFADDGRPLGRATFAFDPLSLQTEAVFSLPLELRNEISRIALDTQATAGSTILLDERWRRRTLGMVASGEVDQPLLSDLYYLERALEPFVDVRSAQTQSDDESPIASLISEPLSILLLADLGRLANLDVELVSEWVKAGGVLVRFAGPRLAAQADPLIPVPLRAGGRELGGALSWTEPQHLAPFGPDSPFVGLPIPEEVTVKRQVLADPRSDLARFTWARLQDGTPLVTARSDGEGWIVLIHVTANTEWSNLALSGLYVDMLRRLLDLSQSVASTNGENAGGTTLAPRQTLDANGRLVPPPARATPIGRAVFSSTFPTEAHPPGLYGNAGAARALNATLETKDLKPLPALSGLSSRRAFAQGSETPLKPLSLITAFALLLLDGLVALVLSGRLANLRASSAAPIAGVAVMAITISLLATETAFADQTEIDEAAALAAVLETHLAYVITGDAKLDQLSQQGLEGLSDTISRRTALEPGAPIGVNVERDELSFFPLLYWPIGENQPALSAAALARVDAYMKQGGTILFDTRDQDRTIRGLTTRTGAALQDLLANLDIPPLEPVPDTHVLTKAFYLLADFPGRWDGGRLWVEQTQVNDGTTSNNNDGVSAILIGSNDYAAAWAQDTAGRPLYAAVPGGERQREIATRFGINLVMYALTGNYKADQVHFPALLERLGQ
jgi:Domain of unknown function (DUF4159)/Aerotolerance regulator N-terminal